MVKKGLHFNEKTHTYTYDGRKLMSVTTWVKQFMPEFDKEGISKKVAYGRKAKGETDITPAKVRAEWKQATDDGTAVHKEIENWIKTRNEPTLSKAMSAIEFIAINFPKDVEVMSETIIYNLNLGLAGTIDFIVVATESAVVKGKKLVPLKRVFIMDWKTSEKIPTTNPYAKFPADSPLAHLVPSKYTGYALQLSTYAYLLEQTGQFEVAGLSIIQLQEERVQEIPVDYMKATVQKMLKERPVVGDVNGN